MRITWPVIPAEGRRDGQGRRLWSAQDMRDAAAAYRQHRLGRGPALTEDQADAFQAHQRWRAATARLRRRDGASA